MTDLTSPHSARRFASFLERDYGFWMASPSVALLSALLAGKVRPARLLAEANAPAFVSNLALITGATALTVTPADIEEVLVRLRTEGLNPGQVWAIATHRKGTLTPTDWLARCAAHGASTIELCLGSLFSLARWSPFPGTFTIVDLDLEDAFAGSRLSALLTSDRLMATRIQQLCLPTAGAQDYILDAWPRGLAHDEPALAELVERLIALDGEKPEVGAGLWSSRLEVADRDAARLAESKTRIEDLQRTIDLWESRFEGAEEEAEKDAAVLSKARSDLVKQRNDAAALQAEKDTLVSKLSRVERERDLAVSAIGQREDADRHLRLHVEQLEKAAAASADRDALIKTAAETARAELLRQKTEAERVLASTQTEKQALSSKASELESQLSRALADAAGQAAAHRAASDEQGKRAAQLQAEIATLSAREAARTRDEDASRTGLSARIAGLEAEKSSLADRLASAVKGRELAASEVARLDQTSRAAIAEQRERADRLEGEAAAFRKTEARLSEELTRLRAAVAEQANRLEAETVTSQKASTALRTEKAAHEQALVQARAEAEAATAQTREALTRAEAERTRIDQGRAEMQARAEEIERGRAALQMEKDAQARELAEVKRDRDTARVQAEERARALHGALEEHRQRVAQLEKNAAAPSERETAQARAFETARREMSSRIAQLETSASAAHKAHAELVGRMTTEAGQAEASLRAAAEAATARLAEAEAERDRIRAESARDVETRREETRRAVIEEQRKVTELSERIARMESEAATAERVRADLTAQKTEADRALAVLRAERDALSGRLTAMENDHAQALAEAFARGDAPALALEAEKTRAEQLARDAAGFAEREAKLTREWEAARTELSDRVRRAEDAAKVARNANIGLTTRKDEAELARASLQAELEEQMRLAQGLKMEGAAVAAREAKKVVALEAGRVEMEARIAKLEAAEVIADKARTELLARKRDSDRALAAVQAERDALLKKVAAPERERAGTVPPRPAGESPLKTVPAPAAAPAPVRPATHTDPRTAAGERNTGGLSGLVDLWNTAVIRRPSRAKVKEEKPPELLVEELLVEALPHETPPASGLAPAPASAPALEEKEAESAPERATGGLSALVNLWNTAATMRPFRRKEEKPDPPTDEPMDLEVIEDDDIAPPKAEHRAEGPRPRPNPPRPPEPKPAPAPEEAENLGGWLRGLAGRMRRKP